MADLIERYKITATLPSVMMNYCNKFNSKQIELITEMIYELENSIESTSTRHEVETLLKSITEYLSGGSENDLDKFINSVRSEVAKRFGLKTDAEIDAFFIGMEESAKDNQEALEKRDKMLRDTIAELCEAKRLLKAAVEGYNFIGHITKDYACPSATSCSACPMDEGKQCRIWEHADEALALIGKDKGGLKMREILFRAKREATNEWVYGYFVNEYDDFQIYVHPQIITRSGREYVNENTLGQFTGLTDKNGIKIFEGDIVLITKNTVTDVVAKIFYSEGAFRTNAANTYDGEEPLSFWLANDCDFEVIGNIYDNPELIGGEKQ